MKKKLAACLFSLVAFAGLGLAWALASGPQTGQPLPSQSSVPATNGDCAGATASKPSGRFFWRGLFRSSRCKETCEKPRLVFGPPSNPFFGNPKSLTSPSELRERLMRAEMGTCKALATPAPAPSIVNPIQVTNTPIANPSSFLGAPEPQPMAAEQTLETTQPAPLPTPVVAEPQAQPNVPAAPLPTPLIAEPRPLASPSPMIAERRTETAPPIIINSAPTIAIAHHPMEPKSTSQVLNFPLSTEMARKLAEAKTPPVPTPTLSAPVPTQNAEIDSVSTFDGNYRKLTGVLTRKAGVANVWFLCYLPPGAAPDAHGGCVALLTNVPMDDFREGDMVTASGYIVTDVQITPDLRGTGYAAETLVRVKKSS